MKSIFKRITVSAAALTLLAGTVNMNVTEVKADEMPVLQLVIGDGGVHDNTPKIQEEINKILAETIGVQVNITWLGWGEYTTQMNLMLTGDNEVDVFEVYGYNVANLVDNGELYDITSYYEEDPTIFTNWVKSDIIDSARVDGNVYIIPSNNGFAGETALCINMEMADAIGMDLSDTSKVWTLDELHDYVAKAVEEFPGIYGIVPQVASTFVLGYTWENLSDANNLGVIENYGESRKVISITECEDFINFSKTMRSWYEEGLIMPDCLSNTEFGPSLVTAGKAFANFSIGGFVPGTPLPYYKASVTDVWASSGIQLSYAVAGNTRYPEESYKLLSEIYNNPDVVNLLKWGIEGENYVVDEDGCAALPEGVTNETNTYTNSYWTLPNTHAGYPNAADGPDSEARSKAYEEAGRLSGCLGVQFDATNVVDEYSACIGVVEKYFNAIMSGSVDTDEALEKFSAELKENGEDVVIEEKQRQIDEFFGQ